MSWKSLIRVLIASVLFTANCAFAIATNRNFQLRLTDTSAITITKSASDPATTLTGFYVYEIYDSDNTCSSGSPVAPNRYANNFVVPIFNVSNGSQTSIGGAALFNVYTTSYYNATASSIPLVNIGVYISAIESINYRNQTSVTHRVTSDSGLTSDQCFSLTCNATTQTCAVSPSQGYY